MGGWCCRYGGVAVVVVFLGGGGRGVRKGGGTRTVNPCMQATRQPTIGAFPFFFG